MKNSEIGGELKRALKYAGFFVSSAALIYFFISAIFHTLRDGAGHGKRNEDLLSSAGFLPVRDSLHTEIDTTGYWVYMGQFSEKTNTWIRRNFDLSGAPEKGRRIVTLIELFKWDGLPLRAGREWKMGHLMGLILPSETVRVIRVKKIWPEDYWALVRQ